MSIANKTLSQKSFFFSFQWKSKQKKYSMRYKVYGTLVHIFCVSNAYTKIKLFNKGKSVRTLFSSKSDFTVFTLRFQSSKSNQTLWSNFSVVQIMQRPNDKANTYNAANIWNKSNHPFTQSGSAKAWNHAAHPLNRLPERTDVGFSSWQHSVDASVPFRTTMRAYCFDAPTGRPITKKN